MSKYYCLARWDDTDADEVDAHGRMPGWYTPQGSVGMFDMRPSSATEYGFFTLDHQPTKDDWLGTDTPDLHILNDGTDLREYHMDAAEKDEWRSLLNLTKSDMADSDVDTLEDTLIWTFERCGDPDHQQRHLPPTATHDGFIEFHLGGHSLLSRRGFTDLPKAAQDRTLAVVQNDMRRLVEGCRSDRAKSPPQDHYRKVATMWARKYSLDTSKGKGQRGWHRLFPQRMRGNVEPLMEPSTTYTESFDQADSDTLGPDLTWTEVLGDTDVVNNQAAGQTTDNRNWCRAEHDLSSDDHAAQLDITERSYNLNYGGPIARNDPNSAYGYWCFVYDDPPYFYLRRVDSNGNTNSPNTPISTTESFPYTLKTETDGSTIKAYKNGSSVETWTDTGVSGNVRAGMALRLHSGASSGTMKGDNFEAADLAGVSLAGTALGTATASPALQIEKAMSGTSTGTASAAATLLVEKIMQGVISGQAVADPTLYVEKLLNGTAKGLATATGDLQVATAIELAGTATGSASASGILEVKKQLAGEVQGNASTSAQLEIVKQLAGSAVGTSQAEADLLVERALSGTATATADITASLIVGAIYDIPPLELTATVSRHSAEAKVSRHSAEAEVP